jgi:DNA mismatch endonuclease, patch repair protein
MTDIISKEKRSWNMSRIRNKNTKPELIVRSLLHNLGYRFRLHGKISKQIYTKGILPGKPDIILKKYKTVIFIHGCFWHRHKNCKMSNIPKSNTDFWKKKLEGNVQRDHKNVKKLKELGWKIIVIWECELNCIDKIIQKLMIISKGIDDEK